ncbi:MAG: helicase-related protein [Ktedonobacteraceae bacterium]
MASLEELIPGALVKGLLPQSTVSIVSATRHGDVGVEVVYKDAGGRLGSELLYQDSVAGLEIVPVDLPWKFDADGALFRLASEAYRIRLAYLFDPLIAVHTSLIEPLPHQITAVYETMLARQPLRYLLADDPGAGKTIMTGLLIKELMIRGDLHRCLIVAPGNLVEQWQDELSRRFHLSFDILTNDRLEASVSGNTFVEMPLCIARLDKLSRNVNAQEMLRHSEWDLIVVDEAHKMSATFFGGEAKYTRRYQLGVLLGTLTRHLLLLTATPHNGKEEDFQLFLRLLDADRFEGKFRDGVHTVDASDLMRHLVKEQLYTFEGRPLFPERFAHSVNYRLSAPETALYHAVTNYVRAEFNRADTLENARKGTVGFALTTLQRRLASSPEAISQSLRRRRERLERRLHETKSVGAQFIAPVSPQAPLDLFSSLPQLSDDDLDDLEDAPDAEREATEEQVVDQATAARTIVELEAEIATLANLEALAVQVRRSGTDRKWEELASLLQQQSEMFDAGQQRHKLVIFTEHRDTLTYLAERIRTLLGRAEAVVTIHGGMSRADRAAAQEAFTQDKETLILVATDAAGEGINLQRAHLMVNYDLPWNPNRLEQRFGRIHRIGQTEVCHLWNLVANETREGEVFDTLLGKLAEEREALGGQVFDVLGDVLYDQRPLRDLIVEAIRYGDSPAVRARLFRVVDEALDRDHLQTLLEERALTHEVMDVVRVRAIREEMERAAARRLQPHFIAAFFLEALKRLGGTYYEREAHRYEITHVPRSLRQRHIVGAGRATILPRYERIVFEKERVSVEGKPQAALIAPGHPLLDVTLDLVLEQQRDLLKQGAILVDPTDQSENPRVLFYIEETIQDASHERSGQRRTVSRHLHFIEMDAQGQMHGAGYAPFLDYRPLTEEEQSFAVQGRDIPLRMSWLNGDVSWLNGDLEGQARSYAITELVPRHIAEVKARRETQIDKTRAAVNERLTTEISYWDNRAAQLKAQESAGKPNARLNSQLARSRAEDLLARLERRMADLEQERKLSPLPPVVIGCALVVPQGLLNRLMGAPAPDTDQHARETARVEYLYASNEKLRSESLPLAAWHQASGMSCRGDSADSACKHLAMKAVMQAERQLGYIPRDVSANKCGYDIESSIPGTGKLRFIEVKGRVADAVTVTVTRNEILTALNQPDDFILAVVLVDGDTTTLYYVTRPFGREPDFGATSVNYELAKLLIKGVVPV